MLRPIDVLKTYFGYESFRPPQEEIIEHVLARKDALVLMPTGGGKSLCYQIPALLQEGITLVISPLISLMKDQVDALITAGVPAAFLNSTLTPDEVDRIEAKAIKGEIKILYMAPERLALPRAIGFLHQARVALIAVDEAHCISEWGHDFRPDYRNLQTLRAQFDKVPVIALTATATERVREDIARQLRLTGRTFISGFDRPNLTYIIRPKQKAFAGLVGLLKEHPEDSAIIYCFSRNGTEELAEKLQSEGFTARAYHAGLEAKERGNVQERFIRDDLRIVTATIAFGMGIDKPDVRLVVHYDLPKSIEGYYQETGRAGRDGLPSRCVLFFTYGDTRKHQYFIDQMEEGEERVRATQTLDRIVRFCQSMVCRRKQLLEYFGEKYVKPSCDGCDVCVPALRVDRAPAVLLKKASAIGPGDSPLFEKLRKLRKRLADERNVPAYIIFSDKSLKDMAAQKPQDQEAFSRVFGVGQAKLEAFADTFIDAIHAHDPS